MSETPIPGTTPDPDPAAGPPATATTHRRVVLALGSNLGNRLETLQGAVDEIADTPGVTLEAVSSVYETDPVGGPEQDSYFNAVLTLRTTLSPEAVLERGHSVENAFSRVREVRWGPRTLDVDVIWFEGVRSDEPDLTLPHPRAHERAFVLVPWAEIDPDAELPGRGRIVDLVDEVGRWGVRRRDDLELTTAR